MKTPFALRRLWLLLRGATVDRDRPDLAQLASIESPERFVWAILPHAARTFAASILLLPEHQARTAAVAYLYCRMLDSYEDLHPGTDNDALTDFAQRFDHDPLPPAPELPDDLARDNRDQTHLLLVQRCDLVDDVYLRLNARDRDLISQLVQAMGNGMTEAAAAMERQGGVLNTEGQLLDYCHAVIGEPALFVMQLRVQGPIQSGHRQDALAVSEMIQLANVTRDIEKDLTRSVGYRPDLLSFLGNAGRVEDRDAAVRRARREMLGLALRQVPAYGRLIGELELPTLSAARASAVMMLLFTDRYYRSCAARVGIAPWRGLSSTALMIGAAALSGLSPRLTRRIVAGVESRSASAVAASID